MSVATLDDAARRRLISTARLLDSDQHGEATAALFAIKRLLPWGVGIGDLVEAAMSTSTPPPSLWRSSTNAETMRAAHVFRQQQPEHQGRADVCIASLDLTDWERSFLGSVRCKPRLSGRECELLGGLYRRVFPGSPK